MKFEKDGQIAVVYSPCYGCGWSTNCSDKYVDFLRFDSEIVQAVLDKDVDKATEIAKKFCDGDVYFSDRQELRIQWLTKGTGFIIKEHDGYERIEILFYPNDCSVA
jgi:hypothetical protein